MSLGTAHKKMVGRSAVCVGLTTVLVAGAGTAYACTGADGNTRPLTATNFVSADAIVAFKAQLAADVAALKAAKAAELAAIKARDEAAAKTAAKAAAAAKAKLRADVAAALAKARAAARAHAAAHNADKARVADFRFSDPSRHHCDGSYSGTHYSWHHR